MADTCNPNEAYNKYTSMPHYSYKMVQYLVNNNELIWKLLKYPTPDAWSKDDLTYAEKIEMIYKGEGDGSAFHVFLYDGLNDVETKESTILNIYPFGIAPVNRTVGTVTLMLEVYAHYKVNMLSNYTTRVDSIIQQLLETFNGTTIDGLGIGEIYFDKRGSGATRMENAGQLPFKGEWLLMGSNTV